jgi:hypothetical protein
VHGHRRAFHRADPDRCTECVGHLDEPQGVQVRPVSCMPIHPGHIETREASMAKCIRLHAVER